MRHTLLALPVLALAACGGSDSSSNSGGGGTTDYSSNFVGTWSGSTVVVIAGNPVNSPGTYTRIFANGVNSVVVRDICGDSSGPTATVGSATHFTMVGITCPPAPVGTCASVNFSLAAGGTGSLSGGQLVITASGTISGCGESYPLTFTFTGSRTSTSPLRADEPGLAEAPRPTAWSTIAEGMAQVF